MPARICTRCGGSYSHENYARAAAKMPHNRGLRSQPVRAPICNGCADRLVYENLYRSDREGLDLPYFWLAIDPEEPISA